mgnify:CR=1 FL=1
MPKLRGFTLIELLITISIISILSAIGLVIFNNVIKQGRDSKRQSDLRSVQSALEQYYADNLSYPTQLTFGSQFSAGGRIYMNRLPTNPVSSAPQYRYVPITPSGAFCYSSGACSIYCLYTVLDVTPSPLPPALTEAGNCRTFRGVNENFVVFPP